MKCPKCSYISFDYNERCPKCNKDLAPEQRKRNLVAFKHNPPFFLGSLTGEVTDIESAYEAEASMAAARLEGEDLDMHLDSEVGPEMGAEVEDVSLDLDDLSFTEDGAKTAVSSGEETPFDESEMVTKELGKKEGSAEVLEDIDIELDLEDSE
jgi:uncharacterized OB-fold protein